MFSFSLCASLVVLTASAVSVSAVPSLSLKTSTPSVDVNGLENLKVMTTVTNTGDETLRLLNDPRGVLNTFPENTFTITDPAGSGPLFNGAKVGHSPGFLPNTSTDTFCPAPRSSTAPRLPLASTTQMFSQFSILALPLTSPTIVSRIILTGFDLCTISRNNHNQFLLRTTSLNLVLGTTPSNRRTCSPTSMLMAPPKTYSPLFRNFPRLSSLATSPSPAPTTNGFPT